MSEDSLDECKRLAVWFMQEAAAVIQQLSARCRDAEARIKELEKENFALAAYLCSEPYGDDYGKARCRIADRADASEARAVAAETKLVQAAGVLKWLDRKGGLGLDVHDYIKSLIIQLT